MVSSNWSYYKGLAYDIVSNIPNTNKFKTNLFYQYIEL